MAITVYIVEDYLLTRVGLKHTLAQIEEIEVAGDFSTAEECIEAMKKKPADIIMMDIGLPLINGIEATKIIKLHFPDTKIIFLTSHQNDGEVLGAISAGASAYCLKESEGDMLYEIIKTVLSGALWLAPEIAKIPSSYLQSTNSYGTPDKELKEAISSKLTSREFAILNLLVQGKTNPEIADELFISTHTAKAHVKSILQKLSVEDRVQAAVKATKIGLCR